MQQQILYASIDAAKFGGQQEGQRHKELCRHVSEVLSLDPLVRESGVYLARYTKDANGRYAYPDVYANQWFGAPAVFEIQLSTTHLPVIIRREDFYRDAGIRLIWIVGYHAAETLNRRAFRDIHMRNDGQILGMDGEVVEVARKAAAPKFRLYRLLPGDSHEGFRPCWRSRIVGPDDISWGSPGSRPRSRYHTYDFYLNQKIEGDVKISALRRRFYEALKVADEMGARSAWGDVVSIVGGLPWSHLPSSYHDMRALGVLATIRTGELHVPTGIDVCNLPHLVNTMLLEPQSRRCWTHAFELMCQAKGLDDLLSKPKVREKCSRNIQENGIEIPIDRRVGAVFDVFFPEGAFQRIVLGEQ